MSSNVKWWDVVIFLKDISRDENVQIDFGAKYMVGVFKPVWKTKLVHKTGRQKTTNVIGHSKEDLRHDCYTNGVWNMTVNLCIADHI